MVPESPLANFGSVGGGAEYGVSRGVRGAAGVRVMETHLVRRPVKGGPARHPPKIASKAILWGVQGSRGPLVGGRRIETAGPLVLSVMKEQHRNEMLS